MLTLSNVASSTSGIFVSIVAFLFVLSVVVFVHEFGPLHRRALVRRGGQDLLDRLRPGDLRLH